MSYPALKRLRLGEQVYERGDMIPDEPARNWALLRRIGRIGEHVGDKPAAKPASTPAPESKPASTPAPESKPASTPAKPADKAPGKKPAAKPASTPDE